MTLPRPSWKIRRRIVVATLLWCAAMVTYLAVLGRDIDLSETIANGSLLLMASVIGSYVFGAVWDDKLQQTGPSSTVEVYQKTISDPATPEIPKDFAG